MAVDEARDHAAPARVQPLVGRCSASRDAGHDPAVGHQRAIGHDPQRALPDRGVIGHQQADVVDAERGHPLTAAIDLGQLTRDVEPHVRPIADDELASDDHVAHVGRCAGEHDPVEELLRRDAREPHALGVERHKIGGAPFANRSARGPTEAVVTAGRRRAKQLGSGERSPLAARQTLVELQRAALLERLDDRVRVTAERQAAAGVAQPRRGTDAIGQIAFGRRAQAAARTGFARAAGCPRR